MEIDCRDSTRRTGIDGAVRGSGLLEHIAGRTAMLALIGVALAFPTWGSSSEASGYLPPRPDAAASPDGLQQTPSDVEAPADWRRGAPGNEEIARGFPASASEDPAQASAQSRAQRRVDTAKRGDLFPAPAFSDHGEYAAGRFGIAVWRVESTPIPRT